jgi:hypothetical protein
MSSSRPPTDPLRQLLDEAESELHRRLHEACEAEAQGVTTESTAEIRRLEDTLLSAAMAAERTIVARRHLREAATDAAPAAPAHATAGDEAPSAAAGEGCPIPMGTVVRHFEDETGRRWRAWPVVPDVTRGRPDSRARLGEFQDGWICFEAQDGSGRRRLAGRMAGWAELSSDALVGLLARAIQVPARRPRAAESAPTAEPPRAP